MLYFAQWIASEHKRIRQNFSAMALLVHYNATRLPASSAINMHTSSLENGLAPAAEAHISSLPQLSSHGSFSNIIFTHTITTFNNNKSILKRSTIIMPEPNQVT
jgi:hypothetical protein